MTLTESADHLPFRPALTGPFAQRFYGQAKSLAETPPADLEAFVQAELEWVASLTINPRQQRIYRAVWLLLRDLLRVGWRPRWLASMLEVAPPVTQPEAHTLAEIVQAKELVRQAMAATRLERLTEAQDFIRRMENPSPTARASCPISELVADGPTLAADLARIAAINETEQIETLQQTIRPYLQLVSEDERCAYTGHKLSDIWRYFRLTWTTPAENTPGRTMLYLIRDAARPNHPVMGIASLENAPLRIAARDNKLGWSFEAFEVRLTAMPDEATARVEFQRLIRYLETAIAEIDLTGLCTPEECAQPTQTTFQKLKNIAAHSYTERETALQQWQIRLANREEDEDLAGERSELGNISKAAEAALYRRKRAERLSQLLFARQKLNLLLARDDFATRWPQFLALKTGRGLIKIALRAQKSRHIGTSLMELNVCGAIPPYNEILGGKLVALLMLSPQVLADYHARYGDRPSDIASRMKGQPVIRPAELVFIGTTSLYRAGASQYNRLKVPAGLLRPGAPEVRWQALGETSGYGTLHISRATLSALEEAASDNGVTYVNHIFGEGASPKLRAMRHALDLVLESEQRLKPERESGQPANPVELTQHAMSRLVYGVWLAANGQAFLADEAATPDYYFDPQANPRESSEKIAAYWRQRWLRMRLQQPEILRRIAAFNPDNLRVSRDLPQVEPTSSIAMSEESPVPPVPTDETITMRDLTRRLYRGASAYADRMASEWLATIHIETDLDTELVQAVATGKSVVLTGNPGDGKTHLLRILATRLTNLPNRPVVELDASAITNADLQARWAEAATAGHPFCVAINEAVLKDLADTYRDFQPIQAAQSQVEQAVTYSDEPEEAAEVVVFDLSRRNILSAQVVGQVLDKLTDSQLIPRCSFCPQEGCDLVRHQTLLHSERLRERLQALLDRVSRRGYHATLRELQGFVSYLLFGGRACRQLLSESGNDETALPQLPYLGEGSLFDRLRETFDPARVTHPVWDELLVGAGTNPIDWLPEWQGRHDALDPNAWKNFTARKRAFYFFHRQGDDLLNLDHDDEREFAQFLAMPPTKALRLLITRINRFFGDDDKNHLRVWQSHRYSQAPRRILYSSTIRPRGEFEIVSPRLRPSMARAFELAQDHALLRLKDFPQARLRVDFSMFELLTQAEKGVPVLSLDNKATRRLWQFMEKLASTTRQDTDARVVILDTTTGEKLEVMIDLTERQYLEIKREER